MMHSHDSVSLVEDNENVDDPGVLEDLLEIEDVDDPGVPKALLDSSSKVTKILCESDGRGYTHRQSMNHHNNTHHSDVAVSCSICDEVFKSKRDLTIHITKDKHAEKRFACDQCDKSFLKKSNLYRHIENIHEKKLFFCVICADGFKRKYKVKNHYKKCKAKRDKQESEEVLLTINEFDEVLTNTM